MKFSFLHLFVTNLGWWLTYRVKEKTERRYMNEASV